MPFQIKNYLAHTKNERTKEIVTLKRDLIKIKKTLKKLNNEISMFLY